MSSGGDTRIQGQDYELELSTKLVVAMEAHMTLIAMTLAGMCTAGPRV